MVWIRCLANALKYIHSRGVCHRDLKIDNIIVAERTNKPRIIDFGFSIQCVQGTLLKIPCGTTAYMAPEIVRKQAYCGFSADIWALGVICYVLLTGIFPFKHKNEQELKNRIV